MIKTTNLDQNNFEKTAQNGRTYIDKEILIFYWTVAGISAVVSLMAVSEHEWWLSLLMVTITFLFLACGWPLKAVVGEQGEVTFIGPIRRTMVSPNNLVKVKAVGANDYRAHIVLRTSHGLPIGYRCRKYLNAAELAATVLVLIEKSPNAKVTQDAMGLLRKTAKQNKKS
jgi:hypothetical protein